MLQRTARREQQATNFNSDVGRGLSSPVGWDRMVGPQAIPKRLLVLN